MAQILTQAIVLRAVNYRENDRILTLFSAEHGKLTATARGSRKATSKFLTASQLFCCGEYVLREFKGHYQVSSCQVQDTFFDLSLDLDAFSYAPFLVNICEAMVHEGQAQRELYVLLLRSLSYLCYSSYAPRDITTIFLLQMLHVTGFRPEVDVCVHCGAKEGLSYFDAVSGGVSCARCAAHGIEVLPVSGGALYALRYYLAQEGFEELLKLKLPKAVSQEVERLLQNFLLARLEKHFRSELFLQRLQQLYDRPDV